MWERNNAEEGLLQRQHHRPRHDQRTAKAGPPSERFAEEERGEDQHEDHAEFVDGRDFRGIAELEGSKIAEPR